MPRTWTYDSKCFDLAEHFIGDGPPESAARARCEALAIEIQHTIEDWEQTYPLETFLALAR